MLGYIAVIVGMKFGAWGPHFGLPAGRIIRFAWRRLPLAGALPEDAWGRLWSAVGQARHSKGAPMTSGLPR